MTALSASRRNSQRATDLRTKREVMGAFATQGSPRVISAAVVVVGLARLVLAEWSWLDAGVLLVTVLLVGVVEWVIHLFLLHAPEDSFRMRVLGTGTGHREHHLDPSHVGWLLLRTGDAALFVGLITIFSLAWSVPLAMLLGAEAPLAVGVTAAALALVALLHYEWTHLLIHTRYRPTTRLYRRLARNHRLHHYRNERYWLGVTSNLGDRLLGTLPADKGDVPLSDTARSLRGAS